MSESILSIGHIVIPLLKGALYQDQHPAIWNTLLNLQAAVQDYLAVLGLNLVVDEAEGFAYLQQKADEPSNDNVDESNEQTKPLPKLMSRYPISYHLSILCVWLRKKILERDASGGELRVILSREQIINQIQVYLPKSGNEAKDIDKIQTLINKAIDIGLLRKLANDDLYEIRRIIKALVDADHLSELEKRLKEYLDHGN